MTEVMDGIFQHIITKAGRGQINLTVHNFPY